MPPDTSDHRFELREFLVSRRALIEPRDVGLTRYDRRDVPGLRREDVAELAGVSTRWYELFESGGSPKRFSFEFVHRIAEALRLDDKERKTLFRLALPNVAESIEASSKASSAALVDSVGRLRKLVRSVCSASSLLEVFTTVAEGVAESFPDAEMVGVYRRTGAGQWDYPVVFDKGGAQTRVADLHVRLRDGLTPEQIDESMLHGQLTSPGQVGTWRELPGNASVKEHVISALEAEGFTDADTLSSRIKSEDGVDVYLFVSYLTRAKVFSELDRTLLGTLADVASLAT